MEGVGERVAVGLGVGVGVAVEMSSQVSLKYWEIIADNLSKAGWSWGCVSALDRNGRTIWIVDAHGYGKRFIVRAEKILTAVVELQRARRKNIIDTLSRSLAESRPR